MDESKIIKLPRLYVDTVLQKDQSVTLKPEQAHYLKNVLHRGANDFVRLFNGRDGEWLTRLETLDKKKALAIPIEQIAPQPETRPAVHVLFSPIKKMRMDWLIEKAVELGVTDLHPVLTQNTDIRKIREVRIAQQIIEASEQCERMDIPTLHPLKKIPQVLAEWNQDVPFYACLERTDAPPLTKVLNPGINVAFLIGPEGGFTKEEKTRLQSCDFIRPVSLGERVLRCETAAIYTLCIYLTTA